MEPRDSERDRLTTADLAAPAPERRHDETPGPEGRARPRALIDPGRLDEFRTRWVDVQAKFVDDPRQTVEEADRLVAELFQAMAQTFAEGRSQLEEQWSRGELGTEDLRQLVHRYRAIFDTLLQH
jgi:hypothetical protein